MLLQIPPVIGHRGAAATAPENTLAGFRQAAREGARWVEFDVRLTGDGRPVIFHDETVDRTTDGSGRVADMTLDEIGALDAGLSFHRSFQGETVPTLEEGLDLLVELGLGANMELKPDAGREEACARAVMGIVGAQWPALAPPLLVSSFSGRALDVVREVSSDQPVGLLFERPPRLWRARARALDACALHLRHGFLSKRLVAQAHALDLAVVAWTVNDPARARELWGWGVDAVITDCPAQLLGESQGA